MLSGVIVASALAALVENKILSNKPIFHVPLLYAFDRPSSLIGYAILGVLAAFVSIAFTDGTAVGARAIQAAGFDSEMDSSRHRRPRCRRVGRASGWNSFT